MARNVLGSLTVLLGLNAAEYTAGLTKAEYQAKQFSDRLNKNFGVIGSGLKGLVAGLAAGFSVGIFASLIKDSIAATAALDNMSEKTGVTVEKLSALGSVAKVGGFDFTSIGDALVKLSKNMAAAQDPASEAANAFKAIGLSVTDAQGNLKNAGDFVVELAKKLNTFADGTGKTAFALAAMGKAGAEQLPFLKDLGNAGELVVKVTAEQAAAAEEYEKDLKRLGLQKQALVKVIAIELVPVMDDFVKVLLEAQKQSGGLLDTFKHWAADGTLKQWFENIALAAAYAGDAIIDWGRALRITIALIPTAIEQVKGLAENLGSYGHFIAGLPGVEEERTKGFNRMVDAGNAWAKQLDEVVKRETLASRVRKQFAASQLEARDAIEGASFNPKTGKPQLPFVPKSAGTHDDTARRLLDAQLKDIERAIKQEEELLRERERFLAAYYQDDKISIAAFYASRQQFIADAISREVQLYNDEIETLRKFASAKTTSPKDRLDAEERIREAIDKRTKAERDAALTSVMLTFEQQRAMKQYQTAIENVAIQLKELQGDTVGAGLARLRQQQQGDRDLFAREGNTAGLAQLDTIQRLTEQQLLLNKATSDFGRVEQSISLAQQRIDLLQQTGAISEIDAINKRSELSKQRIELLRREADAAAAVANAMADGPVKDDALLRVEQMRLAIDQLAAQADVLQKKFNDVFAGAFADALTELTSGTKKFSDVIKDMEKSIVGSINRIAAQNISESLFGKGGPLGGIGGIFADMFSGKSIFGGGIKTGGNGGGIFPEQGGGGFTSFLKSLFGGGNAGGAFGMNDRSNGFAGAAGAASVDAALAAAGATLTASGATLTASGAELALAGTGLIAASASLEAAAASLLAASVTDATAKGASSLFGAFNGEDFGGFFANGGMPPRGKLSIVGEHGPELFVPRSSGYIVPNGDLRKLGSGGGGLNIYQSFAPGTNTETVHQAAISAGRELRRANARV